MKIPPGLLGATVLLWGFETRLLPFAAIVALLIEAHHFTSLRFDLSELDLRRLWTLSTLLFVGAAGYCFISRDGPSSLMIFLQSAAAPSKSKAFFQVFNVGLILFQWLPLIFLPMMLGQLYSRAGRIRLSSFFWLYRGRIEQSTGNFYVNFGFPFIAVCFAAASAANSRDDLFYPCVAILSGWLLYAIRPRRYSVVYWLSLVALVGYGGGWGHEGLHAAHGILEGRTAEWISRLIQRNTNPNESKTSIGKIGKIKLTSGIVMRVHPVAKKPVPSHLRDSIYTTYRGTSWFSALGKRDFASVIVESDQTSWKLQNQTNFPDEVGISAYLNRGEGILAVPTTVGVIRNLPVLILETNSLGAIKVREGPGLVRYNILYGGDNTIDSPPSRAEENDVPETERTATLRIVNELQLHGGSAQEVQRALVKLEKYFSEKFTYSMYVTASKNGQPGSETSISDFLNNTHSGHCEYFATATVLLLRQAGIPARYVTGYVVDEFDQDKHCYLVRHRHAHAWTLVYFNGSWHDYDTTPSTWINEEKKLASRFEGWSDWWDDIWYSFSFWRYLGNQDYYRTVLVILLFTLLGFLAWRIIYKGKWNKTKTKKSEASADLPGADSEFYRIETALLTRGLHREEYESFAGWIQRLQQTGLVPVYPEIPGILQIHYAYRFDPQGLTPEQRLYLSSAVSECMEKISKLPNALIHKN
ncbi:MAG: transglutaminase protein [Verrucomicrobiales bacterium]|nr:transglutaminase protein [Verrucomicrobiales bacterium]